MAISHAHLILLLSLLFFLPTLRATAIPYENCGDKLDPVKFTSVEMFHENFQTSIKISGSTSQTLDKGGDMNVEIKIGVIPIYKKTLDLCEYMDCPVAPGAFVFSLPKNLPLTVPLAKLNVHIEATDVSAEPLMCLTFTIPKLKVPLRSLLNQVIG